MPKFNDNQPDPRYHSTRRLLVEIGKLIPDDRAHPAYQAMSVLWSRIVERQTTFKRQTTTTAHKPRQRPLASANVGKPAEPIADPDASVPVLPDDFDFAAHIARFDEIARQAAEEAEARQAERDNSYWERRRRGEIS